MKILYLILGAPTEGVKKKIYDKVAFLRKADADVSILIVLNADDALDTGNDAELLRIDNSSALFFSGMFFFWRLSILFEQRNIYRAVSAYLKNRHCDLILMRYPVADYFLHRFLKRVSTSIKVVFEHNTLELEELTLRSRDSFWYKYFLWGERWYGKKVRSAAAGLIGVTDEIRKSQLIQAGKNIPSVSISNGIDTSRVRPISTRNAKVPGDINLLFLAGSRAPWHGVDILLNSLKFYKGSTNFHCYIAGNIEEQLVAEARSIPNLTLLSHQSLTSLDELVDRCHIGVGSLALFRNNMKEACTLKVREYWARGLPFVIGYDDTDLVNSPAMQPFYLKVPIQQNEHALFFDLDLVASFAQRVSGIRDFHQTMRSLAVQHIGYPAKAEAYLSFFKSLY
jgi:glycosyltransferase involved in cell wall biosynthesis